MTRTVNVESCTLRRDEKYLVSYKDKNATGHAVSERPVPVGSDVRIRDGRVV
jgi:hypothetical protein